MARYRISVRITKDADVYVTAGDEQAAQELAVEKAKTWDGVVDAEAIDCERYFGGFRG
ncbi:MAG: hypothetical protein KIS96_11360 [Bauldia sp.]|nr:hypothetical protein [Bauldia sp.]